MRTIGFLAALALVCFATPALADVQVLNFDQPGSVDWNRYIVGAAVGGVLGGALGVFVYLLKKMF